MEHSKVRELLSAYLDGELEPSEAGAVEEHLEKCVECAEHLRVLKDLSESVQMTKPALPPEGYFEFFPAKLRARIKSEASKATSINRLETRLARVRVGATVFIVLMAFGIGVMYGQRGLPLRKPRLTPIGLRPRAVATESAEIDEVKGVIDEKEEMEPILASGNAGKDVPPRTAGEARPLSESAEDEVATYGAPMTPGLGKSAEGYYRNETAAEEVSDADRTEIGIRGGAGDEAFHLAKKKGGAPDVGEAYAVANLAQLQQDYDKALDGYMMVVESSPGTELAAGAQFQINMMKTSVDTSGTPEALRESAELWETYIVDYPRSDLVPSACDFYTQALYSVARKTQSRSDVEKAIEAIEDCSSRLKDKSPAGFQDKLDELRKYLDG